MHAERGHPDTARALLERRSKLAARHWKEDPDDVVRQFGLMCAHQSLGQLAASQGDDEVAIESFLRARAVGKTFIHEACDRIVYCARYAGVLSALAGMMPTPEERAVYYEEAFAIRSKQVRLEPYNVQYGSQFARTAWLLAANHVYAGAPELAQGVLTPSIQRVRHLWRSSTPDPLLGGRLESLLQLRLRVRRELGGERVPHEPDEIEECREIYTVLCAHDAAQPNAWVRRATYEMLQGDDQDARESLERFRLNGHADDLAQSAKDLLGLTRAILDYRANRSDELMAELELAFVRADVPAWFTPPERAGMARVARTTTRGAEGASR